MEKIDLNEYLASNEYPGRGIAVAKAPDGRQMFIGYFIMGRSALVHDLLHELDAAADDGRPGHSAEPDLHACSTLCRSAAASAPWQPTLPSWRTPA